MTSGLLWLVPRVNTFDREKAGSISDGAPNGFFPTTHWSAIFSAAGESRTGMAALEKLCLTYWPALYAYARRKGHSVEEAEDLTQAFFQRFLEKKSLLATASPSRGRFRSFLSASMGNFLKDNWKRSKRQKSGGEYAFVSFEAGVLEESYQDLQSDDATPEALYERAWARAFLQRSLDALEEEFRRAGKAALFAELRVFLVGDGRGDAHAVVGERLNLSENAVRTAISRMRRRYGAVLREHIADLVDDPAEVDDELRHMLALLGNRPGAAE